MIKKFITLAFAIACTSAAMAQSTPPTLSEMRGDYIIMNHSTYDGENIYLKEVKPMTISVTESDSLLLKGFYWNAGKDILATYSPASGTISIPAGTKAFDWGDGQAGSEQYLYAWDAENEEVIDRPIRYSYKGDNVWECSTPIMLMTGVAGEALTPYIFSMGSKIALSNATTSDVAYFQIDSEVYYTEESRPSYITRDETSIMVYNLFQTTIPNMGYGCWVTLYYYPETGKAIAAPSVVGDVTSLDFPYKVLAGCEYDDQTGIPTGPSFAEYEGLEGVIECNVDWENGIIEFPATAMWAASYDATNGIQINWNYYFEMELDTRVTFDPEKVSAISTPKVDNANKEVERIELYNLMGQRINEPQPGTVIIKRIYYTDQSFKSEKMIVK